VDRQQGRPCSDVLGEALDRAESAARDVILRRLRRGLGDFFMVFSAEKEDNGGVRLKLDIRAHSSVIDGRILDFLLEEATLAARKAFEEVMEACAPEEHEHSGGDTQKSSGEQPNSRDNTQER